MDVPFRREGECDACVGRHPTAWCCTTIDAGQLFGDLDPVSWGLLTRPSESKALRFGEKIPYDIVKFYRLHGLDGTRELVLIDPDTGRIVQVFVFVKTAGFRMWSLDGKPFTLNIRAGDSVKIIIQTPCREYDPETRKCRVYATRPNVCKRYPVGPGHLAGSPCAYRFVPLLSGVALTLPDGRTVPLEYKEVAHGDQDPVPAK